MPSTFVDYVKIQTATLGQGTLALGAAVPGFRGVEALVDGNTYSYGLAQPTNEFEIGRGVYSANVQQISRGPLFTSDAGNAAISLTGFAVLTVTVLGEDLVFSGFTQPGVSANLSGDSPSSQLVPGYNGYANFGSASPALTLPVSAADGDLVIVTDESPVVMIGGVTGAGTLPFLVKQGSTTLFTLGVDGGMLKLRYSAIRTAWVQTL